MTEGSDRVFEQVLARAEYSLSDKLDAQFSGGVEFRQFDTTTSDPTSPVFALGFDWRPATAMQITLQAFRQVSASALNVDENITTTGFEATFRRLLGGGLQFSLTGGYHVVNYMFVGGNVMQPYLFPYIGYFQMMKSVDEFVIFDDVAFSRGWINRNYYLVGGDKKPLTVSLKDAGPNKLINEIEIIDDFKKIRSTLTQAYAKAPYKQPVIELIERVCDFSDRNPARFVKNSFDEIQNYIGFTTTLSYSSEIKKDP